MHNLCNNKISFYIYIIHIVAFIIFYTYILESIYLYYYNFTITYKIRDYGTVRRAPISEMACAADVGLSCPQSLPSASVPTRIKNSC